MYGIDEIIAPQRTGDFMSQAQYGITHIVDSVICNICGKEEKAILPDGTDNVMELQEWIHFNHRFGYNSRRDDDRFTADICSDCIIDKLIPLLNPEMQDGNGNSIIPKKLFGNL